MQKYLATTRTLINKFDHFQITKLRKAENQRVDALSKLASPKCQPNQNIIIEELSTPTYDSFAVQRIEEEEDNLMTLIRSYLINGTMSSNKKETRKFRLKSPQYTL